MERRKARIKPDDIILDLTDAPTHITVETAPDRDPKT
ncbi:hypothetical protein BH11ARM2_BH11ARM2_27630 [soil metagenome]